MIQLKFMNLKKTTVLCLLLIALVANNYAQELQAPDRIVLNLTDSPATRLAVTWRTVDEAKHSQAQIVQATAQSNLAEKARSVDAISLAIAVDEHQTYYQHSAVFSDLTPNTLYAYRVGNSNSWSEWNQFRTARNEFQPFKFTFLGDPQNELKSLCSRIFRAAYMQAPDAGFWLLAGDIVDSGNDDQQWGEFFYAAGWIPRTMPFILLPGNHEYFPESIANLVMRRLSRLWRPQFTLPENGPAWLEESAYFLDYQGVRFVMLNGNEKLEEQAHWLDSLLTENPNRWTIVSIHQTFYSTGKERDHVKMRQLFIPVFDRHHVDLVLQGHDHSYGRTFKLRDGVRVPDSEPGTVYVVSVSGPKVYSLNPKFESLMAKLGNNVQLFQVISVEWDRLQFQSFTATGEIYDEFELNHVTP
ncbi:MAG: fibronectin type III domain-containing protein [Candidatus Zhuqueibacterota bacterium]